MKLRLLEVFLCIGLLLVPVVHAQNEPQVEMFSPQGTVKGVRQVAARFSEQMVPFGDPRGLIEPFDIDCPEKGTDHRFWIDAR